jgi:hypothetical protein
LRFPLALFAWLISHQPAVLFSQNKPVSTTLLSEQTSTSHQPTANRTGSCLYLKKERKKEMASSIFGLAIAFLFSLAV